MVRLVGRGLAIGTLLALEVERGRGRKCGSRLAPIAAANIAPRLMSGGRARISAIDAPRFRCLAGFMGWASGQLEVAFK